MRRCYFCGIKKYDDEMLCEKCKKELEEKLKKKHKQEYFSDTTNCENCTHYGEDLHGANCRFCYERSRYEKRCNDANYAT